MYSILEVTTFCDEWVDLISVNDWEGETAWNNWGDDGISCDNWGDNISGKDLGDSTSSKDWSVDSTCRGDPIIGGNIWLVLVIVFGLIEVEKICDSWELFCCFKDVVWGWDVEVIAIDVGGVGNNGKS